MSSSKNRANGKKQGEPKPQPTVRDGYKILPPTKNKARREMLRGEDVTTSGGCRTVHHQPA